MKLPNYIDFEIVGAGVQALTLTTHLLKKSQKYDHQFLVFYPSQLRNFAEARYNQLFAPYSRPGTKLFNDFCHEVIRRWK